MFRQAAPPQKPVLKTRGEIDQMKVACQLVAKALKLARDLARPGVRTTEIDQALEQFYKDHGATPLFKGYPGNKGAFPAATCISLNEQVVHGIPGPRVIRPGDLVKLDTACKVDGWCGDSAICFTIGDVSPELKRLVRVAEETLALAIREVGRRRMWSEVAAAMAQYVQAQGFSVVERFVGHGIGRVMHEPPQVPNYTSKEMRQQDFRLEPGLTLAIEPMVNMGRKDVQELPDHWTVITRDRLPSAHVEHTVALTENGVEVLTLLEDA
jgi:methionyl aminopeptidase